MNIIVVGFNSDCGKLDIKSINDNYNIEHFEVPFILRSLYNFFPRIFYSLFDYFFSMLIKDRVKEFDNFTLITDDEKINSRALKFNLPKVKFKKCVLRNYYRYNMVKINPSVSYYSFDDEDCSTFGFIKYNQYCSGYDFLNSNNNSDIDIQYDFYFLGIDKGRRRILDKLSVELEDFRVLFEIKKKRTQFHKLFFLNRNNPEYVHISYVDYLNFILKSNVVVDIVQPGQSGVTMKTLEAVAANKKIITNNKSIKKQPFYSEENILIINDKFDLKSLKLSGFLDFKNKVNYNFDSSVYSPRIVLSEIIEHQ